MKCIKHLQALFFIVLLPFGGFAQANAHQELISFMNGQASKTACVLVTSSNLRVKSANNERTGFVSTTANVGVLSLKPADSSCVATYDVGFSDRNFFAGKKDKESIALTKSANGGLQVKIAFNSWGNTAITLSNVQLRRDEVGLFITGNHNSTGSSVNYTIAIYKCNTPD